MRLWRSSEVVELVSLSQLICGVEALIYSRYACLRAHQAGPLCVMQTCHCPKADEPLRRTGRIHSHTALQMRRECWQQMKIFTTRGELAIYYMYIGCRETSAQQPHSPSDQHVQAAVSCISKQAPPPQPSEDRTLEGRWWHLWALWIRA